MPFESLHAEGDGTGVTVAVVDTAIALGHEDLDGLLPGWDAIADRPLDPNLWQVADADHGTHVAGLLAATPDNDVGGIGAAPGVQILPVRVLRSSGGFVSDVVQGILWAIEQDADIINLSLGTSVDSAGLRAAVEDAESKGIVVIAASGNLALEGSPRRYPAAIATVIAVGAVDENLTRWSLSSQASYLDVVAPGASIWSLGGRSISGFRRLSGTSMAAPQVAAAVALLLELQPDLSPAEVRDLLRSSARDLGPAGQGPAYGFGLLDPAGAVQALAEAPPKVPPPALHVYTVTTVGDGGRAWTSVTIAVPEPQLLYWIVTNRGRVLPFGAAPVFLGPTPVEAEGDDTFGTDGTVIGGTPTSTGEGYWLVDTAGRVAACGDAEHHGDVALVDLNQPIVGMSVTPTGGGYWLVAQDGGVFAFGDAVFHRSTGAITLNEPMVSMTAGPSGYWLVAADGGVFTFGVPFHGSIIGLVTDQGLPAEGMRVRAVDDGEGYVVLTADGSLFGFG
ncbi:MAG: S8 family serine peptidase [Actinomycetota bacterium]|nr:S8 family serine peptidase [Actinomycetota bacterium]